MVFLDYPELIPALIGVMIVLFLMTGRFKGPYRTWTGAAAIVIFLMAFGVVLIRAGMWLLSDY